MIIYAGVYKVKGRGKREEGMRKKGRGREWKKGKGREGTVEKGKGRGKGNGK